MTSVLSNSIWEAVLAGLEEQGRKVDEQITEVRRLLAHQPGRQLQASAGASSRALLPKATPHKRTLSAEARARIAKAQKLRWAKIKKSAKKAA